jgi:hypothetical protein
MRLLGFQAARGRTLAGAFNCSRRYGRHMATLFTVIGLNLAGLFFLSFILLPSRLATLV